MEEFFFTCPYCWETISMVFDITQPMDGYVEDCEVCCRPIEIDLNPAEDLENVQFIAKRLDD